jgi:NDP-sugar pyrophosphorylase family protein
VLPVAILAGGLATRLRPLTDGIPKSLAPVLGEPFAFHQLRQLRSEGVERVVFCVGYKGEMIEQAIGDGSAFGLNVAYSFDGPVLKGTGGALRQALPLLGDAFFVLYGDSYLRITYAAVEASFRASGMPALMTVLRNEGKWDTSNVVFDQGRIQIYDKTLKLAEMRHIDYGLGVLSASLLTPHGADEVFDLAQIYSKLAAEGRLAGYEAQHRFYEIGTLASLREAEAMLAELRG